jgi:chromosome segregation ATPase
MAKDISVGIVSETKPFQKGIKDGVIEPLEGAVESIEELGKSGEDTGDQLTDAMKDAQKKTEILGDEYTELRKKIDQIGKQGSDSWKKVKDGSKDAEEGMQDFKSEANQTAKETAASFDGSAESIVDMFQETAANALSGFGPAGAVAGLALAAGIGFATQAFQQSQEDAQKLKEKVSALTDELLTTDGVSLEYVTEQLHTMATATEDGDKKLKDLKKTSEKASVPFDIMAEAVAGNQDAIDALLPGLKEQKKAQDDIVAAQDSWNTTASTASSKSSEYNAAIKELEASQAALTGATDAATLAEQAGYETYRAKAGLVDNLNTAYDDAVGAVGDFVNAESGVLDVEAYLSSIEARQEALRQYQERVASAGLTPEQLTALNDMGTDAAAQFMAGYESASPEQQRRMKGVLDEAAKTSSGSASEIIAKTIPKTVETTAKVSVDPGTSNSDLDKITKDRTVKVVIDWRDKYGKPVD